MNSDYDKITKAIHFIAQQQAQQVSLEQVASAINLSPSYCQRLFSRYAGISPKQFLQYLTVNHAKQLLRNHHSVFDSAMAVGLSGAGRLHDHFVTLEAVTPGEYRAEGEGVTIRYGQTETLLGKTWVAFSERGICRLSFDDEEFVAGLAEEWPKAILQKDHSAANALLNTIFSGKPESRFQLQVRGTNFQLQVWQALLAIPEGQVATYQDIANAIGKPSAVRAVGSAIGANPVAYLIPCHRVIRGTGALAGYRWGLPRKQLLLAQESACNHADL